ncbi:hypothetical protein, partial [Bacillus sp. MUM 116]|uniref:hypothetical protein n=1 Tax=Bacillus sp. MUM 116 TaxID=1678002 RepID=UPI001C434EE2
ARKFTLARVLYIIEETRLLLFVDVFVCLVFKEQYHSQKVTGISFYHIPYILSIINFFNYD